MADIYIVNKALSFNPNYLNIVNLVQKYSAGQITQKEVFKIYFNLLPSKFRFYKWIKGKKEMKTKIKLDIWLHILNVVQKKQKIIYHY